MDGAFENDFAVEYIEEKDNAIGIYLKSESTTTVFSNQLQYLIKVKNKCGDQVIQVRNFVLLKFCFLVTDIFFNYIKTLIGIIQIFP